MCRAHLEQLAPATRAALGPRPRDLRALKSWMYALSVARREVAVLEEHVDVLPNIDEHLRAFSPETR